MKTARSLQLMTFATLVTVLSAGCTVAPVERTPDQVEGSWTVVEAFDDAFVGSTLELRADGSFTGEGIPAVLVTGDEGTGLDTSGTWSLAEPLSSGQPWTIGLRFDDATAPGQGTNRLTLEGPADDPDIRWWLDIDAGEFLLLDRD